MCGILGALAVDRTDAVDTMVLRRMLGALRHRGPDEFGTYLFGEDTIRVGLGCARLSIIDLPGGQQPIANEDGSLWIVFNGEIYNHPELRRDLEQRGHRFRTRSDTEVIVHLFEEHGPNCVRHLNGQFAFAIWSERTKQLFLARDRCGVRPLFYTRLNGILVFASEIKAICCFPGFRPEMDPLSLAQVFTYWSPLSPGSAFSGIHSLPPGCTLTADSAGNDRLSSYWRLEFPARGKERFRNEGEALEVLRETLSDAVQLRLRSDVPVGAYVSGGLDSTVAAALIHGLDRNSLETFSISFTDPGFDEAEHQQRVARFLGTKHHQITTSPSDIGGVFPAVMWHAETPVLRTAPAPLFLLSARVRERGFKVVLTGEGADEFLGGYDIFKEMSIRRFWAREPQSKARPALLERLYPDVRRLRAAGAEYRARFFSQGLGDVASPTYSHSLRWRHTGRLRTLLSPAVHRAVESDMEAAADEDSFFSGCVQTGLPDGFAEWSSLAQAQYLESTIFLSEYLLSSQGDRMSMAHSVEGRYPFLDHRLIEFTCDLAPALKLHGLREKRILKKMATGLIPPEIVNRIKRPYRAPIRDCFFPGGQALEWVDEVVGRRAIENAGLFDPDAVAGLIAKAARTRILGEMDSMALVGVLSAQMLHRLFVDRFAPPDPVDGRDNVLTIIRGIAPRQTEGCP
jgi:asparagine synthase (glutamine-hydrolysing)